VLKRTMPLHLWGKSFTDRAEEERRWEEHFLRKAHRQERAAKGIGKGPLRPSGSVVRGSVMSDLERNRRERERLTYV